ncbi:MAG: DUF3795 domain-containing protein [Candidatus Thermoplasmatota archaeon]|nr:DUF3795 domain-containing protein [Candidatus Thermoplasmatota archaeon]
MEGELVAPCGMNCSVCSGYLALKNDIRSKGLRMTYCTGCRPRDKKCAFIKKRCDLVMNNEVEFCFQCETFPCEHLSKLDAKYRKNFKMSFIENLKTIRDHGMDHFLEQAGEEWKCPECGGTICCHNGICFQCGIEKLKARKQLYRWENE